MTTTALRVDPVAKKNKQPPAPEPEPEYEAPTQTVRIDKELLAKARIVCAHTTDSRGKQLKLGDYIHSLVSPAILRDYERVMKEIKGE